MNDFIIFGALILGMIYIHRDMSISVKIGDDVVKIQDADKTAIKDLEDI